MGVPPQVIGIMIIAIMKYSGKYIYNKLMNLDYKGHLNLIHDSYLAQSKSFPTSLARVMLP